MKLRERNSIVTDQLYKVPRRHGKNEGKEEPAGRNDRDGEQLTWASSMSLVVLGHL
jgi:hypothetical protein